MSIQPRHKLRWLLTLAILLAALTCIYFVRSVAIPGPIIPLFTPNAVSLALKNAYSSPPTDTSVKRPGWAKMTPTKEMDSVVELGERAVPALVANLDNRDRHFRMQCVKMLTMVQGPRCVPVLLGALRGDDHPTNIDGFIVAKLAEVTDHPRGFEFYRVWHFPRIQVEAKNEYQKWWENFEQTSR